MGRQQFGIGSFFAPARGVQGGSPGGACIRPGPPIPRIGDDDLGSALIGDPGDPGPGVSADWGCRAF